MTQNTPLPPPPALPQDLGGGLVLRWATAADADALAEFNIRIHSDEPDQPEAWLGDWTRDLLSGRHPTAAAADAMIVEDTASGAIASTLLLIPQTWTFEGIPLGVGRVELVGTDQAYRRRGLVRLQMDAIHALSASYGHHLQAITGIPWYYRQFGYEMAVDLGGGRYFFWARGGNDKPVDPEPYELRPATAADIPLLAALYAEHTKGSLLAVQRDEAIWRWGLEGAGRETEAAQYAYMISPTGGEPVAYVEFRRWGSTFGVRELGVRPGHAWREVALFVTRELGRRAKATKPDEKDVTAINFLLHANHPVYAALDGQLDRARRPYAWFLRVPDLPRLLWRVAPALEARLAASAMAAYSGSLRLNFFREALALRVENGRLAAIDPYTPDYVEDADAFFPELTFLQLLFGHRSLKELSDAFADCYPRTAEATALLEALFPRHPSYINYLS